MAEKPITKHDLRGLRERFIGATRQIAASVAVVTTDGQITAVYPNHHLPLTYLDGRYHSLWPAPDVDDRADRSRKHENKI